MLAFSPMVAGWPPGYSAAPRFCCGCDWLRTEVSRPSNLSAKQLQEAWSELADRTAQGLAGPVAPGASAEGHGPLLAEASAARGRFRAGELDAAPTWPCYGRGAGGAGTSCTGKPGSLLEVLARGERSAPSTEELRRRVRRLSGGFRGRREWQSPRPDARAASGECSLTGRGHTHSPSSRSSSPARSDRPRTPAGLDRG